MTVHIVANPYATSINILSGKIYKSIPTTGKGYSLPFDDIHERHEHIRYKNMHQCELTPNTEFTNWINDHIEGHYELVRDSMSPILEHRNYLIFEREEDAMLYLMKWS